MNSLPPEVLQRILRYLPLHDQLKCERVCLTWCNFLRSFWPPRNGILLDNFTLSILCDERVETSSKYMRPVIPFLECIFKRFGIQIRYIRVEKTTELTIQFLANIPRYCPNLDVIWFGHIGLMYYESEANSLPSLAPLVSVPSLHALVLNSNSVIQIDARNWSVGRQWAIGTVCPVVQLFPIGLDRMTSGLTKLWLEDVMLSTNTFITLCNRLGSTLECFCLKLEECSLQKVRIAEGLRRLTRLVHLNFASHRSPSKTFASLLDGVALEAIGQSMTRLETLSLRGAFNVTSIDVNGLLNSSCGRFALRYLNLTSCPKVNSALSSGIYRRSSTSVAAGALPLLTIFAYLTDVEPKWAQRMSGTDCRVIINPKDIDESVFWGEEKSHVSSNSESDSSTQNDTNNAVALHNAPQPLTDDSSESD